jgi:hypothetical protein
MHHRFRAPRSTAETPDEQCQDNQQSERTRVRVTLIRIVRVVRLMLVLIRHTPRLLAFVTKTRPFVTAGEAPLALAAVSGHITMAREGYLGDGSRMSEGVVLGKRNQKREKQNADGRN